MSIRSILNTPIVLVLVGALVLPAGCLGDEPPPPSPRPQAVGRPTTPAPTPRPARATPAPGRTPPTPAPGAPTGPGTPTPRPMVTAAPSPGGPELSPQLASLPAPVVSLAVNGAAEAMLYQGWPLLADLSLLHPQAGLVTGLVRPMIITVPAGAWSDTIHLETRDMRRQAQTWPLHFANNPTSTLALDAQTVGALYWWLAPEDTAHLAAGTYTLIAVLDSHNPSPAGEWQGTTASVPVSVRIEPEPQPLPAETESLKVRLSAGYEWLRGHPDAALAMLDALLAKQAQDIAALELKGDLLAGAGRFGEALPTYDAALAALYAASAEGEEPPEELLEKRHTVLEKLLTAPP